jgi:hypothetical protein
MLTHHTTAPSSHHSSLPHHTTAPYLKSHSPEPEQERDTEKVLAVIIDTGEALCKEMR